MIRIHQEPPLTSMSLLESNSVTVVAEGAALTVSPHDVMKIWHSLAGNEYLTSVRIVCRLPINRKQWLPQRSLTSRLSYFTKSCCSSRCVSFYLPLPLILTLDVAPGTHTTLHNTLLINGKGMGMPAQGRLGSTSQARSIEKNVSSVRCRHPAHSIF